MNKILWDLINTREVASFIDDIIVGTEGKERHDEVVEEAVKSLAENDLYVNPEKYKWKVREVGFLGVVIGWERIKIEKEKLKAVLEWPASKLVKNVQKFLGLANYYRRFVKGFAKIVRPLHELITKLILIALDLDKKIRMEVDMLDYVTKGVLLMIDSGS